MKTIPFLALIISLFIFSSCSANDPEKIAVESVKCMLNKDFDKLLEYIEIPENLSENEIKGYKERALKQIKKVRQSKTIYKEIDEHGGADKVQVVKNSDENLVKNMSDEKEQTRVEIEVICKDGEKINIGGNKLILQNGKWKVAI